MGDLPVPVAVGRTLAALGASQVFGLIGSGNFAVTNALVAAGVPFVAARHEGGAITMADAYARVSGEVGLCSVHQGPGLTNAITGLTEAAKSRTPLLLLAADTAAAAIRSNFRIAQDQLVAAVGAAPERLHGPASAIADTVRAYRWAQVERRPIVLMLPLDIQAGHCPWPAGNPPPAVALRPAQPTTAAVVEAARILASAQRPLIIAGRGAALAGAREALERLAERSGALLATSAVANGLFAGNPWALGIAGGFASPTAAELIGAADVVLGFGVALNMWTTRHGHLLSPDVTIIQVDHEAEAIGAHHRVDLAVPGDAAETARAIGEELAREAATPTPWRTPALAARIRAGAWQNEPFDDASADGRIDPRTLSRALDALLPEGRTVATDSGHFMGYPAMYLRVPDARGFVFTQAFQAVGLGLASAIGAAVARPDRLTVAALGDGGALMGLSEMETVARLGLRMLIVIYNDAAYGAEVHHFGPQGASLDLVRFPDVDFAALGRAVGLAGVTVRAPEDLRAVEAWLTEGRGGALVLDAKVVPTVVAAWLEEAFRGH
ncbi:MAG: TPP-requiring enzyme co-localized with fatty acid metabolic genes [uncultured Thermomicrobiales bacterium]|uniref:TPP-requiring enzyme co-localized with fatty acid metabolic genes n=1 Tax=uncultured Thermomicrobiales bacterium TaxID=1645740 RepID=A0A6J4VCA3_9BACT|nr:MAG: TPP-requiring enzyme co-localized with fatty acid metabolic genes [uncultured Thermomicrobiales bacterium]